MAVIQNFMGNLNEIGFFDILLPFVLVLALVYGLLQKAGLFGGKEGKGGDKINAVIAISLAFFAINYTSFGVQMGAYLSKLFGSGSLVIATILLFIIALQLFGIKLQDMFVPEKWQGKDGGEQVIKWGIVFAVLGVGAWAFFQNGYSNAFQLPFLGSLYLSSDLITTLVVLGVIGIAVWLILKSDSSAPAPSGGGGGAPAAGAH